MPDITMCQGGDCPLKTHCYRFTAPATEYGQSYFVHLPYQMDGCPMFVRDTRDGKVSDGADITEGK